MKNREAIETRIKTDFLDIPCQYCAEPVLIPKSVEERYANDYELVKKQKEIAKTVRQRTEEEIDQFKADQQYVQAGDHLIHILHLSDIHLENEGQAKVYRTQLETDLIKNLGVKHLECLVITGDITNHATVDEYKASFELLDGLVKRFGLDSNRVVIVPGNHDVNWDDSEDAYQFISKRKVPAQVPEGTYIQAGEAGVLLRDEELYRKRFAKFNTEFYKRVYGGIREYPLDYDQQAILIELLEDRILFLALNSSWQIDHYFHSRDRAGIKMEALSNVLDCLQDGKYDCWLKIAAWHHPVTGQDMMNNEFMELLAVNGFQVCMHGHIHEAIEGFHKYDD